MKTKSYPGGVFFFFNRFSFQAFFVSASSSHLASGTGTDCEESCKKKLTKCLARDGAELLYLNTWQLPAANGTERMGMEKTVVSE